MARFLLLFALAAALLVACDGDGAPRPAEVETTEPAARQQQEDPAAQTQPVDEQSQPAQPQPDVEGQSAEQPQQDSTQDLIADEERAEPSEPQPIRPSGPPQPEFDIAVANGYLEHLAGVLGPRTSGTEQERAAAEFLAETFRSLGYEVEVQEFAYTTQAGISRIDAGDSYSSFAFRFRGSAEEPIRGELVNVPGFGEPADFESVDVSGKIAIVNRGLIEFRVKGANAVAAGAIGLIIANRTLSESIGGTLGAETISIPLLHVSKEAGDQLRTRLGTAVSIPESSPNRGESQNVIARRPNGECRVVVGGHYDTVPEVDGANDNASGTALTLALAETWSDHPAGVDICFIGFGAEELGLHGSAEYVRQLRAEDQTSMVTAMLNLDAIGDGRAPYRIIASFELQDVGDSVAADLQINAATGSLPMELGSDHASFSRVGIPVVFVFPPGAILHTPLDNLENVDYDVFQDISRLNHGILACLLERAGSPISPTISCAEE